MARMLLLVAAGAIVLAAVAIARKFRHLDLTDHMSPNVLTRIRTDYPDSPA
jgi:hypothetical protein